MRRFLKSWEIRFWMASSSLVEKSQAILALLDGFQELHLDCQACVIIVFHVFFPGFLKSSVVYVASLYTFERLETMI